MGAMLSGPEHWEFPMLECSVSKESLVKVTKESSGWLWSLVPQLEQLLVAGRTSLEEGFRDRNKYRLWTNRGPQTTRQYPRANRSGLSRVATMLNVVG